MDLSKLVAESIEEGKRAMEERERELRAELRDRIRARPGRAERCLSGTGPSVDSARGGPADPRVVPVVLRGAGTHARPVARR